MNEILNKIHFRSNEDAKKATTPYSTLQSDYQEQILSKSLNDAMENAIDGNKYEVVKCDDHEETKMYCDLEKHDSDTDPTIESFDEGLGDISSESEIANWPTPKMSNNAYHTDFESDKGIHETIFTENASDLIKNKLKYSPKLNRGIKFNKTFNVRIAIETPL